MGDISSGLSSAIGNRGPGLTHITLIVDRSYSMVGSESLVKSSVKSLIEDQQAFKGKAIFTLAQFDHEYDVVFQDQEIKEIKADQFRYKPNGGTSLYDAIIKGVQGAEKYLKEAVSKDLPKPKKIVIGVITDGDDTTSHNTVAKTRQIIEEKLKSGWNILLLGANGMRLEVGKDLGIPEDTTAFYNIDKPDAAIKLLSQKVTEARRGKAIKIDAQERLALQSGDEKGKKDL